MGYAGAGMGAARIFCNATTMICASDSDITVRQIIIFCSGLQYYSSGLQVDFLAAPPAAPLGCCRACAT